MNNKLVLTLATMMEMRDKLYRRVYYGTSDQLPRGQAIYSAKTTRTPEFIVLHPDDLEEFKAGLGEMIKLVHLREFRLPDASAEGDNPPS